MDFIGRTITIVLMLGTAAACDLQPSAEQSAQRAPAATAPTSQPSPASQPPANQPPASQPATQPSTRPTKARPVIALLDFGQPPYQTLRYSPRTGEKQTVELTIKTSDKPEEGKAQLPGLNYPDIKLTMDVQVQEVTVDGSIRYSIAFTHGDVASDPAVVPPIMPAVVERFRKSASALVGVSATTEVTDRGAVIKSKLDVPNGTDPSVAIVLGKVDIALEQLWTMLPDEPIGVGGKWRVEHESDANTNNVHFQHSVVYQVSSFEAGRVRLTAVVQDKGDRQPMRNAGPSSPYKMVLTSLNGTGRGEMNLDLTQIMPLLAEVFVQTTSNVEIQMEGSAQGAASRFVIMSKIETKPK